MEAMRQPRAKPKKPAAAAPAAGAAVCHDGRAPVKPFVLAAEPAAPPKRYPPPPVPDDFVAFHRFADALPAPVTDWKAHRPARAPPARAPPARASAALTARRGRAGVVLAGAHSRVDRGVLQGPAAGAGHGQAARGRGRRGRRGRRGAGAAHRAGPCGGAGGGAAASPRARRCAGAAGAAGGGLLCAGGGVRSGVGCHVGAGRADAGHARKQVLARRRRGGRRRRRRGGRGIQAVRARRGEAGAPSPITSAPPFYAPPSLLASCLKRVSTRDAQPSCNGPIGNIRAARRGAERGARGAWAGALREVPRRPRRAGGAPPVRTIPQNP